MENKFGKALKEYKNVSGKSFNYKDFSDNKNKEILDVLNSSKLDEVLLEIVEIENALELNDKFLFKKVLDKYGEEDILCFAEIKASCLGSENLIKAQKINYFLENQGIIVGDEYSEYYKDIMDRLISKFLSDENNDFFKLIYKYLSDRDIDYIMKDMFLIDDEDGSWLYDNIYQKSAYRILVYLKNNTDKKLSEIIYLNILESYISQYNFLTKLNKYNISSGIHLYKTVEFKNEFLPDNQSKIDRIINEVLKYKNIKGCEDLFTL